MTDTQQVVRSPELYNAVMSSPLVTVAAQQVYYVLWTRPDGLTKGEIEQECLRLNIPPDAKDPWHRQVATMQKMGIVQRGNKRHCTAKNKEDAVWLITNSAPKKPLAAKPSAKKFKQGVEQLENLIVHHEQRGDSFVTPQLKALYEWVASKVK